MPFGKNQFYFFKEKYRRDFLPNRQESYPPIDFPIISDYPGVTDNTRHDFL